MSEQNNDVCIICQEHGTLQNYIIENTNCKCKYYYHESCFPPARRIKCPMCTKEIQHVTIEIPAPSAPPAPSRLTIPPVSYPIVQPNLTPLLSSQTPIVGQRVQIDKRKIPGCICATIIIIAIVITLVLIIGHGN